MNVEDLPERIYNSIIVTEDGCWRWVGYARKTTGYGTVWWFGKAERVHRLVYRLLVGDFSGELTLDHECHNAAASRGECGGGPTCLHRRCVNPEHLRLCSNGSNVMSSPTSAAARNAAKTHCLRGHAFTLENTIKKSNGRRNCRKCHGDDQRRRRAQ